MKEGYYLPGSGRAERVQTLFDRIASRYDLINDLQSLGLHRAWKKQLLRWASVKPGESALDVCCGTGDLAEGLAASRAATLGCDFSQAMLQAAARREGRVQYVRGDALALPFRDSSFDIVTIGYGLRNLADFQAGLNELLRVARPGGRILILDFGKPSNVFWRAAYFAYLRMVVPLFGLIFCGDAAAYSYILQSLKDYPAQDGVTRLLRAAGCQVELRNLLGGVMSIHHARKPNSLGQRHDVTLESGDMLRER